MSTAASLIYTILTALTIAITAAAEQTLPVCIGSVTYLFPASQSKAQSSDLAEEITVLVVADDRNLYL